jgi:hypothetical protein
MLASTEAPFPAHPDEMRADVELRLGRAALHAKARTTPNGLMSVGVLVSLILLSTAMLVRAAKQPAGR